MKKKKTLIIVLIAAALLVGVMLLLIFLPKGGESADSATLDEGAKIRTATDKNGVHQVVVATEPNGEIKNNSYGTLIEYTPAQIKSIHVENQKGTLDVEANTPKGEATVYTLKGYEDFSLQSGIPDQVASAAASMKFTQVASASGDKPEEYGLDKPRATVTVTYTDKTKSVFTVGNDAPQSAGTYVQFGSEKTVYLCDGEAVKSFDLGLTDFMDLNINKAAENDENGAASSITLTGEAYGGTVKLVPNDDGKNSASYKITEPEEAYANISESSNIEGGIRGLLADTVELVNPSAEQLKKVGLDHPYAKVTAVYPDVTVKLSGTKPNSSGTVYLMADGGKLVYTISADKVAWADSSYERLQSEYVLNPTMTALTGVKFTADKDYDFALETKVSTATDNEGSETSTTETTVHYGDEEIPVGDFTNLYDDISLIKSAKLASKSFSGKPGLKVVYTFSDGSSDTVEFYPADGQNYTAVLNGKAVSSCYSADVTRVINDVKKLTK